MKLRSLSRGFFAVVMVALAVNFAFLLAIGDAFHSSRDAVERRASALALVDGLRHETEILGRLVRAYTATADSRYLMVYYDILAVRAGDKPPPAGPDAALAWEHVIAGLSPYRAAEGVAAESLPARVRRMDFGSEEQRAVQAVLAATEALHKTEQIAFAATQGLYDTETGSFVSDRAPAPEFARKLVHSPGYEDAKAHLADAVGTLSRLTDQRTAQEVQVASDRLRDFVAAAKVVDLLMALLVAAALLLVQRRVLQPIDQLASVAQRFAGGDYAARSGLGGERMEEVGALGRTLDRMAKSIEDDIATRDRSQREVEEARALAEAATQAKSMFLANMSHEIRTPMNAIIGMTHLALGTELSAQQRDYLQKVHRAATMLLGILNDILDFSKIEAGKLTLESLPCRVEELVDNALMLLRERAQDKDIELLCDYVDADLLGSAGVFWGDPLRLGQVLTNLLSNAVKFTEHGHVKLRVELLDRSQSAQGEELATLRFGVIDTGVGMTAEQRDRLFREFTQADGSTTRRYGGTGLGLTIARRLTELMHGHIEVESLPGQGSRFHVTLPVRLALPLAQATSSSPTETLDGPHRTQLATFAHQRVLVVDDHTETRTSLLNQLKALGVGRGEGGLIEAVATGQAALARVTQSAGVGQPFDLVLLDWVLPDLDGGEVLHRLQDSAGPPPRVMVISAYGWDNLRSSALNAGASGFLPKPIVPETLRRALQPGQAPAPDALRPLAAPSQPLRGLRTLLVEDNPVNRQLASELLGQAGAEVTPAEHGREALTLLERLGANAFDVVLMDLQMPVLDGYETTRAMREHPQWQALPVLAMTAHAMVEERERCLALGMRGHIAKPIDPAGLIETLRAYLPERPVSSAAQPAPAALPRPQPTPPTPTSTQDTLETRVSPWHAIDLATAARWCAGVPMARRSLAQFVTHYADSVGPTSRLRAQLVAGRWGDLAREAHTLKGLGRQLGMAAVSDAAQTLETLLKAFTGAANADHSDTTHDAGPEEREARTTALESLLDTLTVVLAELSAHPPLPTQGATPPPALSTLTPPPGATPMAAHTDATTALSVAPMEPTRSGSLQDARDPRWSRLRALLESSDSQALLLWHEARDELSASLSPPAARALHDAIQNCDFERALTCLPAPAPLRAEAATEATAP